MLVFFPFILLIYTTFAIETNEKIFTSIYQKNIWGDPNSVSGVGSNLEQTSIIREKLPTILKEFDINILLDVPCGDCYWISKISLPIKKYIGIDIVLGIIKKNKELWEGVDHSFFQLDLIHDPLPKADLILCRDCLVHFSIEQIYNALINFKKSGASYLLMTTFTGNRQNYNIKTGNWRPLNFQLPPFNFPSPLILINEGNTQYDSQFSDKSLALWKIEDIPI